MRANGVYCCSVCGGPRSTVKVARPWSSAVALGSTAPSRETVSLGEKQGAVVTVVVPVVESYELANLEYRLAIRDADPGVVRAEPFSDLAIPLVEIWESGI
jgi:hypothetical protein